MSLTGLNVVFGAEAGHGWELVTGRSGEGVVHIQALSILELHHTIFRLFTDGFKHFAVQHRHRQTQVILHHKRSLVRLKALGSLFSGLCKCLQNKQKKPLICNSIYSICNRNHLHTLELSQSHTVPRLLSMWRPHLERVTLSWSLLVKLMTVL